MFIRSACTISSRLLSVALRLFSVFAPHVITSSFVYWLTKQRKRIELIFKASCLLEVRFVNHFGNFYLSLLEPNPSVLNSFSITINLGREIVKETFLSAPSAKNTNPFHRAKCLVHAWIAWNFHYKKAFSILLWNAKRWNLNLKKFEMKLQFHPLSRRHVCITRACECKARSW